MPIINAIVNLVGFNIAKKIINNLKSKPLATTIKSSNKKSIKSSKKDNL